MQSVSNTNFGPLIAYLVPGATVLLGFTPFSATLSSWFATAPGDAPTIGGFLYPTLASLAAGAHVGAVASGGREGGCARWGMGRSPACRRGLFIAAVCFPPAGGRGGAFPPPHRHSLPPLPVLCEHAGRPGRGLRRLPGKPRPALAPGL